MSMLTLTRFKPILGGFVLLGICLLLGTVQVSAQSARGTITGIVKDASGGIVPGAEISLVEKATGVPTTATTTDAGVYRVPYVPLGTYKITASLPGFKTAIADNVQVLLGQTVTVDFTLEVGQVSEMVTVSAQAPLLETSTSEIGINSTEKEVHTWPIMIGDGTRQLQDFIFRSMPGTQGGTFEGTINGGQAYSHEILIDGITIGRYDLNGGSNNEFTPTMDAVSEFKLQTGALGAQYGNTQTALVNFGLKSGTNTYHGTAFWFHRDRLLNANSWGNNLRGVGKSHFLDNNFGAVFGGPLSIPGLYDAKDKTHFFVSYEGQRSNNQTVDTTLISAPIPAFRQGDFSRLLDPAFTLNTASGTVVGQDALGRNVIFGQIYDPNTSRLVGSTWVRDPFPGNIIPSSRISAVTRNVLKHDIPNPEFNAFRMNTLRVAAGQPVLTIDNVSFKLDQVIGQSHKFSTAYVANDRSRLRYNGGYRPVGIGIPGPAAVGDRTQATPGRIVRVTEDWTVSSTKINHFAFGFNRFRNANQSNSMVMDGRDWASELGLRNVGGATFPIITFGGPNVTLTGQYGQLGDGGTSNNPNGSWVIADDFTWLRGGHSFRFGVEHRRYYINNSGRFNTGSYAFNSENTGLPRFGTANFANQTGFAYASFLLGAVQSSGLGIPLVTFGTRSRTTGFYIQDDWKASSHLTFNFGIRWDIPTPFIEVADRMSGLDPKKPNPGANNFPGALAFVGDCSTCIGSSSFGYTYYKQFAPRVGFAWSNSTSTLVVRGGYGLNYSPPIMDGFDFPYSSGFNGTNPINSGSGRFLEDPSYLWDNPRPPFTQVLPNRDPSQLNNAGIGYYLPETSAWPYVQNWNIGIQYGLPGDIKIETNYVGNKGTRLSEEEYKFSFNQVDPRHLSLGNTLLDNINDHPEIARPYPSFTGLVSQALRPFPQYQTVSTHRMNGGFSSYHSFQTTVIKRSNYGLSFIGSYTFSKSIALSDTAGPGVYAYGLNFYNRHADKSVTVFNFPNDLKVTWIYDLPFGPQGAFLKSGFLSRVLGGWTMSAIQRYRSGPPLAIASGGFDARALFANGGWRGDVLLPRDQQVLGKPSDTNITAGQQYLNPAAFGNPPRTIGGNVPIRFGNASRFLPDLRGFAIWSEDFAIVKRTDLGIREGTSFEIRADMINVFNRVRLGNPRTDRNNPNDFGKIFEKAGGPRNIQIGLRLNF